MDERIRLRLEAKEFNWNTNGPDNVNYSVPMVRALDFWFRFMVFNFNVVVVLFIHLYNHVSSFYDKIC